MSPSGREMLGKNHVGIRAVKMVVVQTREGEGIDGDPVRVVQYWYEGEDLRFIVDPFKPQTLR